MKSFDEIMNEMTEAKVDTKFIDKLTLEQINIIHKNTFDQTSPNIISKPIGFSKKDKSDFEYFVGFYDENDELYGITTATVSKDNNDNLEIDYPGASDVYGIKSENDMIKKFKKIK